MLDPPSEHLQQLLTDFKLCSKRDLRACRHRVRRLAHDLPAFDSIWIDALVQARKLTSFQAKVLESDQPDRLRVGPCLLVDRLGQGPWSTTHLARRIDGQDRCVVKRVAVAPELVQPVFKRLTTLVTTSRQISHPSVVVPHACKCIGRMSGREQDVTRLSHNESQDMILISRFVSGLPLSELLIRRGRFPSSIVFELGRQLLNGLADLEALGIVHGDIWLRNVRLVSHGTAVLVDTGVRPALQPELTIHAGMPAEWCDGIAPELIGTGSQPTAASDLYALGCLLWQLLAGRPPFPSGDPLAKLAAHQTQTVPDVRDWTLDTPSQLAESLRDLTASRSECRPQTIHEALERWRRPSRLGRRRLRKFRALFDTGVPHVPPPIETHRSIHWPALVVVLFVLSGAVLTFLDRGAGSQLLNLAAHVSDVLHVGTLQTVLSESDASSARPHARDTSNANSKTLPLPAPNAEGIILLDSDGPYDAAKIVSVGALIIRGVDGRRPRIVISETPMTVWAEQFTMENVTMVSAAADPGQHRPLPDPPKQPAALLLVHTQNLMLDRCRFQTHPWNESHQALSDGQRSWDRPVAVAWKTLDSKDRSLRMVSISNSVFSGHSTAVYLGDVPQQLHVENCLRLQSGAFLDVLGTALAGANLHMSLRQLTLRESGALFRCLWPAARTSTSAPDPSNVSFHVVIEANDCVFDLQKSQTALFEWLATGIQKDWPAAIEMRGEGSLANPELTLAASVDINSGERKLPDPSEMQLEGIVAAPFAFDAEMSLTAEDSVIASYQAPRRSSVPPGIDPMRLPKSAESGIRGLSDSGSIEARRSE